MRGTAELEPVNKERMNDYRKNRAKVKGGNGVVWGMVGSKNFK